MKPFVFFLGCLLLFSCDPKETPEPTPIPEVVLKARLQLMHNGVPVQLNQRLYNAEGHAFEVEVFSLILSNVGHNDKSLFDATRLTLSNANNLLFSATGNPQDFSSLSGAIGVVEPWNNADPVSFEADSPLYLNNSSDMHWGWAGGYIFYKLEGKFNTDPDAENLNEIFTYHMGNNIYRKLFDWSDVNWTKVNDHLYEMIVYLHIDQIFDGPAGRFSMADNKFTHATADKDELNQIIAQNFAHALRLD
jgi:hypothetical protein